MRAHPPPTNNSKSMADKLTREQFEGIFSIEEYEPMKGDEVLIGLNILSKYSPNDVIEGADHDVIWCTDIDNLIENGIDIEDAYRLRDCGFFLDEENNCLSHYV